MTGTADRLESIDTMRGIAVMAILLMNIVSFAMPGVAYINPLGWGGTTTPDLVAWAINFVLVDGKMRGLFSMLFGASMLLVIDGAYARDQDGYHIHRRRMWWLAAFGLIHAYFIWYGDILFTYAICGLIAVFLVPKDGPSLLKWAIGLLMINAMIWIGLLGSLYWLQSEAAAPGADPETIKMFDEIVKGFITPDGADLTAHRGSYGDVLRERAIGVLSFMPLYFLVTGAIETIGLFALGMAMLRNDFLKGAWGPAQYRRFAVRMYAIGLPPMALLTLWVWVTGFDPLNTAFAGMAAATLFRPFVMMGHAALAMLIILRFAGHPLMARITAAGRVAFTNYIGTSILMTTLFYGYGGGLYGHLSRWQIYLVVPVVWAIMLLWSAPWLARYRYGPLEWLWRSLARGTRQPMVR